MLLGPVVYAKLTSVEMIRAAPGLPKSLEDIVIEKNRYFRAFTAIVLAALIAACTDQANVVGATTVQNIVGQWKSESITRQGTLAAKFSDDGTCHVRESGGTELPCTWTRPGDGQARIAITFRGRSDASYASVSGDRLFISEPSREYSFTREEYKILGIPWSNTVR